MRSRRWVRFHRWLKKKKKNLLKKQGLKINRTWAMPDLLCPRAINYTKPLFSWSRSSCWRIWTDSPVQFSVHLCSCLAGLCPTEARTRRGHIWTRPLRSGRTLRKGRPTWWVRLAAVKRVALWRFRSYRRLCLSKGPSCGWSGCTCNLNLGRVHLGTSGADNDLQFKIYIC